MESDFSLLRYNFGGTNIQVDQQVRTLEDWTNKEGERWGLHDAFTCASLINQIASQWRVPAVYWHWDQLELLIEMQAYF